MTPYINSSYNFKKDDEWEPVSVVDDDGGTQRRTSSQDARLMGYPHPEVDRIATDELPIQVQVVAPCVLTEGYLLDTILADGSTVGVKVPVGGIEQGQIFTVGVSSTNTRATSSAIFGSGGSDDDYHTTAESGAAHVSIPVERWRDCWCECFNYGVCHPHCWTSWCCPLIAAGQVQTRLNLKWLAMPNAYVGETTNTFAFLCCLTLIHFVSIFIWHAIVIVYAFDTVHASSANEVIQPRAISSYINQIYVVLVYLYAIVVVVWLCRIRKVVRAMYSIPGNCVKDCLLSCFCTCCTAAQLLRHTTDYSIYHSHVFTKTGVSESVTPVPSANEQTTVTIV